MRDSQRGPLAPNSNLGPVHRHSTVTDVHLQSCHTSNCHPSSIAPSSIAHPSIKHRTNRSDVLRYATYVRTWCKWLGSDLLSRSSMTTHANCAKLHSPTALHTRPSYFRLWLEFGKSSAQSYETRRRKSGRMTIIHAATHGPGPPESETYSAQ